MADFGAGTDKATRQIIDGAGLSIKQFEKWGNAIAQGGEKGQTAMFEATKALAQVDDAAARNQLGTKMFGTMWEDQGKKIVNTLLEAKGKVVDYGQQVETVNKKTEALNSDPTIAMRQAFSDLKDALDPILQVIAEVVSKLAEWAQNNPTFVATITAITTVIGIFAGAAIALAPIIYTITTALPLLTAGLAAISTPVLAVVAGIGVLIAAGIALYQNWDTIKAYAVTIWGAISKTFSGTFSQIKSLVQSGLSVVKSTFTSAMSSISNFVKSILDKISAFWKKNGADIKNLVSNVLQGINSIIQAGLGIIKGVFQAVWPLISGIVKIAWAGIQATIKNALDIALGVIQFFLKVFQGDWKGAFSTIKDTALKIMNNIVSAFKSIDLGKIGTDIIKGLVKGIKSMVGAVKKAVE
ncbi:hypothetical protein ABC357_17470, partial [Bacillus sp. 1P06AnD]